MIESAELNRYRNIKLIDAKTIGELEFLLANLNTPYSLLQLYHDGQNHIACILPMRKINDAYIRRIKNGKLSKKESP